MREFAKGGYVGPSADQQPVFLNRDCVIFSSELVRERCRELLRLLNDEPEEWA